jgi:putative FmdB family regulatory protein
VYAPRNGAGKSSDVGSPFGPAFPHVDLVKRAAHGRYTRRAMPTYEYVCKACGHLFEIVQSMRDDPLTECPECGGELRKVFAPPAISFKGSGFYATDHGKKKSKQTAGDGKDGGDKKTDAAPKKEAAATKGSSAKDPSPSTSSSSSSSSSSTKTPSKEAGS